MHLTGVELATIASPHDFSGIGNSYGPVKTLPEPIAHEGVWRRMMSANSGVDVPKQFPALRNGDAALQNTRGAAFVQLIIDQDERLSSPGDALRLSAF